MENLEIKTKLKFEKSAETGLWVGFIFINPSNGYMKGVRSTSKEPKKICIVKHNSELESQIEPGVLYDVELVPMRKKNAGYIVKSAEPHTFEARIETCVVHNAVYWVKVSFGNKTIVYNPLDGRQESMKTIKGCIATLSSRKDIKNLALVISEFTRAANIVLCNFENDGYYVSKENK